MPALTSVSFIIWQIYSITLPITQHNYAFGLIIHETNKP